MSYYEVGDVIGVLKISSGSRKETAVPYDTLFTYLLLTGSYAFITIHNHPNNNPQKSNADIQSDEHLKQIADLLNITYIEGLIITKKQVDDLHQIAWKEEKNGLMKKENTETTTKSMSLCINHITAHQYDQSYSHEYMRTPNAKKKRLRYAVFSGLCSSG